MNVAELQGRYRAEGVLILRGILPPAELMAINDEMNDLFVLQLSYLGITPSLATDRAAFLDNARKLLEADTARYISTARLTQDLPSVHRVLTGSVIVDVAKTLGVEVPVVSTKPSVHIMSDALKIPNGYHKTPPHQDWRSMQGSLDSMIFWIPTTPVGHESHALEVVPGSHLFGLLETTEHIMTPTVNDPRITDDRFVPLLVEPGDVILFSSLLVHRTGEAGDGLARIALSTRFNNALEPTYVARGFATPYKYSYRLDLLFPDFPSVEQVSAVFASGSRA